MARVYLLFAACVAAVTAGAVAKPEICSKIQWGEIYSTTPYQLSPSMLAPGIRDWQVKIPTTQLCPLELVQGVEIVLCDYDTPPVGKLEGKFVFDVHRTGNLMLPGEVDVTLYCPGSQAGSLVPAPKNN